MAATACAADVDPVAVLMRLRDGVMEHAERIPNRTCVETVVRDRYEAVGMSPPQSCDALLGRRKKAGPGTLVRLATTDRLRLDVALSSTEEIYSWAGAKRFNEGEIDELISTGAIGTGPFASSLLSLFEANDPHFVYEGEKTQKGRRLLEFSFRVQQGQSRFRVKTGKEWTTAGYTGSIFADPETAELVRLEIRSDELPRASTACEVDTAMDYGATRLAGNDILLPAMTRSRFINQDGSEAENAMTFSACREFLGEATVNFGGHPEMAAAKVEAAPVELPSGLNVTVEMTSTLDLDRAAAGDRIEGRLAAPLLDAQRKTILVPAGAVLEGRLMRVETRYGKPNEQGISLRWETLEMKGVKSPVSLVPDWSAAVAKAGKPGGLMQRGQTIELPRRSESRYWAHHFSGDHVAVPAGLVSQWFTSNF